MKRLNHLHDLFQRINKNRLNDLQKSFSWSTKCGHSIDVYILTNWYLYLYPLENVSNRSIFEFFQYCSQDQIAHTYLCSVYTIYIHIFNRSKPWKKFCLILCTIYIYHKLVKFYWNFIYGQILYILSTFNTQGKKCI